MSNLRYFGLYRDGVTQYVRSNGYCFELLAELVGYRLYEADRHKLEQILALERDTVLPADFVSCDEHLYLTVFDCIGETLVAAPLSRTAPPLFSLN
jgi:hypothetical protein